MSKSNKPRSKRARLKAKVVQPAYKASEAAANTTATLITGVEKIAKSTETARLIAYLEDQVAAARRDRKLGKGTLRSTYIEAYRGFVAGGDVRLRMRVMEEPRIPPEADKVSNIELVQANLRRVAALAFPGLEVTITTDTHELHEVSDRHGYVTVRIPANDLEPGWHKYSVLQEDPDGESATATGEYLVPNPKCKLVVVSDIDDTILQTGLSEGLTSLIRTFSGDSQTRSAVPGMANLYHKLTHEKIGRRQVERPFLYLSTGGWALYEMLVGFLEHQEFPKGVLFLTDWLPQERFVLRSGKAHKLQVLRRLLAESDTFQVLLIGDSGQEDAYTYTQIAEEHPGRVKAILILSAGDHLAEKHEELEQSTTQWRATGIPFYLVEGASEAEEVLRELNIIQ